MRAFSSATCAAVALTAGVLLAPAASAQTPGDNGDVKTHNSTTAPDDHRDEPKVCTFYLDAFDFDGLQSVSWTIDPQPAHKSADHAASGTITLGADGNGHTEDMTLPDGMYKLYWTFDGEHGEAKHKVFKVDCASTGSTTGGSTTGGSTTGGSTTGGSTTGGSTTGGSTTGGSSNGGSTTGGSTTSGGSSSGGSSSTAGSSGGGSSAPSASPSASTASSGGSLAATGASVGGVAALAVLLLGAGVFVRFRRKGAARQH
ncbi:hypothetical protein SAMN05216267_102879 [Actinacidiphila rubida]|uniref:Uncharacterized protein n=1 Tax=Actinacidiphila rubida TaxID=310780 RepID=A0A1H8Q7B5_9ACTN|nr:hypothetical protein [Actinacidiphila rubida]SEO49918.1 hypothetical protein SAMN05216267_102879 [Actinacidiphila rubida]